jgi:hypothetical protein
MQDYALQREVYQLFLRLTSRSRQIPEAFQRNPMAELNESSSSALGIPDVSILTDEYDDAGDDAGGSAEAQWAEQQRMAGDGKKAFMRTSRTSGSVVELGPPSLSMLRVSSVGAGSSAGSSLGRAGSGVGSTFVRPSSATSFASASASSDGMHLADERGSGPIAPIAELSSDGTAAFTTTTPV